MKREHTCDFCGKTFTHKPYKVYDENYNIQHGIVECQECYNERIFFEEDINDENFKCPQIFQNENKFT